MTKKRVSREDLYAQVWATPMSRLAANYGISDVALAKTCKRMNVPRPGRGYWARLAAGQKTKRVPLPRLQASDETFGWLEDLAEPAQRAPREPRPEVPLPRDLRAASDAVREIGTALADAPNDSFNRLLLGNERDPAFAVSVASHRRALLLLDGLVKALEARGHRIELRREGDKPRLVVLLGQEQVALSMTERPERVEHTLTPDDEKRKASGYTYGIPKYDYVVGGNLQLRIGAAGFGDGKSRKLEQLLGSVVVAIEAEAAALAMRRRAEESKRSAEEERRRQAEAERERIQRHEQRVRFEAALESDLKSMAAKWSEADQLRRFLAAVEAAMPVAAHSPEFAEWYRWALDLVAALDPLARVDTIAKPVGPIAPIRRG